VVALLDDGGAPDAALGRLIDDELVERRRESRLVGQEELAFRHALLREAAYATLTEADRVQQHRRAAVWLESAGEHDPAVLAEHWERAGENDRAATCLLDAARRSYRGGDNVRAAGFAERALALIPRSSPVWVKLQALRAAAHGWLGHHRITRLASLEVVQLAAPGSREWYHGVAAAVTDLEAPSPEAEELMERVLALPLEAATATARFVALSAVGIEATFGGRPARARAVLAEVERVVAFSRDPLGQAHLDRLAGVFVLLQGHLWDGRTLLGRAIAALDMMGAIQAGQLTRLWLLGACLPLGRYIEALEVLAPTADRENPVFEPLFVANRAYIHLRLGQAASARGDVDRGSALVAATPQGIVAGTAHLLLGRVALATGMTARAREHLHHGLGLLSGSPTVRFGARELEATLHLHGGDPAAALAAVRSAVEQRESGQGCWATVDEGLELLRARALAALGRAEEAHAALIAGHDRLLGLSAGLPDDEARQLFLAVPAHARIVELAGSDDAVSRLLDLPLF
jgi:tetratricopeptide (TPR) repeat protein